MELKSTHALLSWCLVLSLVDVLRSSPIVSGKAAKNARFPFAVAFARRAEKSKALSVFCGGSLISESSNGSWAISAAHCFLDLRNETIYGNIGGGNLADASVKWWKVAEIISARFNVYTLQNDVALVRLESTADHQQVIRRARTKPNKGLDDCLIYGYGSTSYATNTITSSAIRFGRVDVISHRKCEDLLGRVSAPSQGLGQFCALGRKGADACNGVTSHGSGCGEGAASVYESVAHHQRWIDASLEGEQIRSA